VLAVIRAHLKKIATVLVQEGRLDEPEDIFRIFISDIDVALKNRQLDVRALVKHRTALHSQWSAASEVPTLIDSRCRILRPKPKISNDPSELIGYPISAGKITARVKILHTPTEKPLFPGEILVARATNPGWTPLFVNASGIILEVGGMLQHGALVAREYGKPCVAGIEGVVDRLQDGMLVEVDGSAGIVRIVEQSPLPTQ
jgi:rifampicin phosphotransferase